MNADIILPNFTAYNVTKFDVRLGETFRVQLSPEAVGTARWFADKDPVLNITVKDSGGSAEVQATASGPSEIQVQVDGATVLTLFANVFNPDEAANLGITTGTPEPK